MYHIDYAVISVSDNAVHTYNSPRYLTVLDVNMQPGKCMSSHVANFFNFTVYCLINQFMYVAKTFVSSYYDQVSS